MALCFSSLNIKFSGLDLNFSGLNVSNTQINTHDIPLSAMTFGIVIKFINRNFPLCKHVFMFQSNCDQFALNTTDVNSLEWANLSDFFVLGRTKLSICLTKLCIRKKRLAKCCTQVLMMFLRRKAIKDLLYCQWPSIRAVFCNFLIIFLYIGFFCICIYVCLHFLIVYLFVGWTRQLLVAVPPCEVGWGLLGGNLFQKHLLLLFATIAHHLSKIKKNR